MVRLSSKSSSGSGSSSNGMMGTGVHGMLGTTILCKSDDTSYYCMFSKMLNSIIMFFVFVVILYAAYTYLMPMFSKKSRK